MPQKNCCSRTPCLITSSPRASIVSRPRARSNSLQTRFVSFPRLHMFYNLPTHSAHPLYRGCSLAFPPSHDARSKPQGSFPAPANPQPTPSLLLFRAASMCSLQNPLNFFTFPIHLPLTALPKYSAPTSSPHLLPPPAAGAIIPTWPAALFHCPSHLLDPHDNHHPPS